ncbi:MAG TPA: dihydroorotate dehydrogenase electron transfer subunit [Desulfohalobiaceae bacterium]|nr:dihydroorotate dehydrogenase electron transfer subunit [Desulfohalobiaceae bacterium]
MKETESESKPKSCQSLEVVQVSTLKAEAVYHLQLNSPRWSWRPGQFAMIRPEGWGVDPFTARPFSIADQDHFCLDFFWQVVGKGTLKLTELVQGQRVIVWGPLGNGFAYDPDTPTLLLAGGMGIIPFYGLINNHPRPENLELIFGHRQGLQAYPYNYLAQKVLAWDVLDRNEMDLQNLERALRVKIQGYSKDGQILACGPYPFLRKIQNLSKEFGAKTQISVETYMACGIGACLGCVVVKSDGDYTQACLHGPVFNSEDIIL